MLKINWIVIMTHTVPKPQLILSYIEFYGIEPPQDKISLIKHISKESILYEIVALNYRLKTKDQIQTDTSFETQIKELRYFINPQYEQAGLYIRVVKKYTDEKLGNYPIIFNRRACLFAIEEIINSDEMQDFENFEMAKIEVWEAILKYLLAVNYTITKFTEEKDNEKSTFEYLNPKLLPLNEFSIETDQIFTPYRGFLLIDHFLNNPKYTTEINDYFQETYKMEPQHFILWLMRMYMSKSSDDPALNFFYLVQDGYQDLFNRLSVRIKNSEAFKLLSIRKSPFIKVGELEYLVTDISFLIEKGYTQFLNDFWFDKIKHIKNSKGEQKFTIDSYRSEFGYFFEKYVAQILTKSFENYKYSKLLMFDQLKINTSKGHIEIADIYLRYGNKILLGQVKSGSIYDNEKFGGSVESLYKNDRDKFFENFGVNQVINSISAMDDYILNVDHEFPKGHQYKVYPCIIVNDKAFQTPLMPDVFNIRFHELLIGSSNKKVLIQPLTIIHISDLEVLEDLLSGNPKELWSLLEYHHRDKFFSPPFYGTVNKKWPIRKYPERILDLFKTVMLKYNPEESNLFI